MSTSTLYTTLYKGRARVYSDPVAVVLGELEASAPFTLRKHQIAQVLCQVRFSPVLRLRQEDAVIPFQDAVRDRYPDFRAEQAVGLIITPDGVSRQENPDRLWRFVSGDDGYAIVLTTDFVAVETSKYVDVDDLCSRLRDALALVQEHYAPAKATRVGLRFLNEVRFAQKDLPEMLSEAFNPLLLGSSGAPEFASAVKSSRQVMELTAPENLFQVRHGLHPGGGTTVDPSTPSFQGANNPKPFYLIDMDASVEAETNFSLDGIDEKVRLFNEQMRAFFAWAVKEDFRRDVLGQEDAA
jgi:uncharacterized protein (TIGR04255 family)